MRAALLMRSKQTASRFIRASNASNAHNELPAAVAAVGLGIRKLLRGKKRDLESLEGAPIP